MAFKIPVSGNSPKEEIAEYPLFDWLRIALASAVALGHAQVLSWEHTGNLAVQIFFALSGWLIGGILLQTELRELPRFYFNRVTRVWLPYLAALLLLYTLSALRDPVDVRWVEFLVYDLTFTHNWFTLLPDPATAIAQMPLKGTGNHFWSLAVEEQFYLATPLLMLFFRGGKSVLFWVMVVAFAYGSCSQYSAISFGVLAATLNRDFGDWHLSRGASTLIVLTAAVCVTGMLVPTGYVYAAPVFAIAIVLLAARAGTRTAAGKFFGGMSYPLYLNHWLGGFIVNGVCKRIGLEAPMVVRLGSYAAGLLVGAIAYVLVDQQIMTRRGAFYSQSRGWILGILAYGLLVLGIISGLLLHFRFTPCRIKRETESGGGTSGAYSKSMASGATRIGVFEYS